MYEELDKKFKKMLSFMKENNTYVNTSLIKRAYEIAKTAHQGQFRESGDPYVMHPLSVAEILAYQGFDSNVVAAALLHDVVEDVEGMSTQKVCEETNREVADIVDAVTKIDAREHKDISREELDQISFNKFIRLSAENQLAFYVKLSDRIHNLRTINGKKDPKKRLRKAQATRKYLLPIAKELKAKYFYNEIDNLCFKILDQETFDSIKREYDEHVKETSDAIEAIEHIFDVVHNTPAYLKLFEVRQEVVSERQIYHKLIDIADNFQRDFDNSFLKCVIPIRHYIIVMNSSDSQSKETLFEIYKNYFYDHGYYYIGEEVYWGKKSITLEDQQQNHFQLTFVTREEYYEFQNGARYGVTIHLIDDDDVNAAFSNKIIVFKRDGEKIEIEDGSTVLDFAFAIHKEIGLCAQYAYLNKNNHRVELSTKLTNGDRVEIVADTQKGEYANYTAEFKWFEFLNTKKAIKTLVRYFEDKYNK